MLPELLQKAEKLAICHNRKIVHGSAIFVMVAGIVYSFIKGTCLNFPDERQYFSIALNIASGRGFSLDGMSPTALFPPGWPFVLAFLIKLGASCTVLHMVNFLFLAASIYVMRSILAHEKALAGAAVSSILAICYCVLFYTAGTLYPQTLFTLLVLLLIRAALDAAGSLKYALFFGLMCGLVILVHSTGVFIPPVVGLWIIFSCRDRKAAFKRVAVAAMVASACVLTWTTRNYVVFHRFIPLTTHGGDTLYIGNNPHTSLRAWYNYVDDEFYQRVSRLPEAEQNRYYVAKTLEFWTKKPWDALKLYLVKLADYFNFYNNLFATKFDALKRIVMFVTYYPLLACLILRLFHARRIPLSPVERLFVIIYFASALFHALFVPRIRFRLPYDVILITHIGIMFSVLIKRQNLPECQGNRQITDL